MWDVEWLFFVCWGGKDEVGGREHILRIFQKQDGASAVAI